MDEKQVKREALEMREEYALDLEKALRKARTPADYERLLTHHYETLDQVFAEKLAQSGDTIACKAGCSYCCYIKVDTLPIEVFYLVNYITSTLDKRDLDLVHARAKENRQRIARMTCDEQQATAIQCPLLNGDGCCMYYAVRPATCRRYHSNSAVPCQAMFECKAEKDMRGEVVEVMYPTAAICVAAQRTFTNAGFDANGYDFSSALDEALSNQSCYRRWRERKSAFSKEVIAKLPQ